MTGFRDLPRLKETPILAIDDEPVNLKLLDKLLRLEGYSNLILIGDSRQALDSYRRYRPGLILLDLNMPHLDGYAIMRLLQEIEEPVPAPVIVLTAQLSDDFLLRAFAAGARDYLVKPFDRAELMARVRNLLEAHLAHRLVWTQASLLESAVKERTAKLQSTRLLVVRRLGRAAEYRDNETGNHILRMSKVSTLLASRLGWNAEDCELMLNASPMHDVGKIGIPDEILLKPGRLTPAEMAVMQTHAEIGADILSADDSDLLMLAQRIAISHHEKWDGSGYPFGLSGEDIPLEGRIVAVADVFDALTSERPYKDIWPLQDAVAYIQAQAGRHFDPAIVSTFCKSLPDIVAIRAEHVDVVRRAPRHAEPS